MAGVEVFDDAAVVQRQIVTIILFFTDGPALPGGHFLGQLQNERFTVYDDAIKIEDNGAQQVGWGSFSQGRFLDGRLAVGSHRKSSIGNRQFTALWYT